MPNSSPKGFPAKPSGQGSITEVMCSLSLFSRDGLPTGAGIRFFDRRIETRTLGSSILHQSRLDPGCEAVLRPVAVREERAESSNHHEEGHEADAPSAHPAHGEVRSHKNPLKPHHPSWSLEESVDLRVDPRSRGATHPVLQRRPGHAGHHCELPLAHRPGSPPRAEVPNGGPTRPIHGGPLRPARFASFSTGTAHLVCASFFLTRQ